VRHTVVNRRTWIAAISSLALGCSRRCDGADEPAPDVDVGQFRLHERSFDRSQGGPQKVVVLVPAWASATNPLPLLIALHGRGEANRGLDVGAWAWVRDYGLARCAARLRTPPLHQRDMLGLVDNAHVERVNESLRTHPWQGVIVACPYTTDILGTDDLNAAAPFADFVADHLIPRIRADFPVIATRDATGIDGVSLGGRMALLAAASRPEVFGAVGTLQAAFRVGEVSAVASTVRSAWQKPVHPSSLRLMTSKDDPFRSTLERLAHAIQGEPVNARYEEIPGPHNYAFNRGPGGIHMLLWHDRVLRGMHGNVWNP